MEANCEFIPTVWISVEETDPRPPTLAPPPPHTQGHSSVFLQASNGSEETPSAQGWGLKLPACKE